MLLDELCELEDETLVDELLDELTELLNDDELFWDDDVDDEEFMDVLLLDCSRISVDELPDASQSQIGMGYLREN